MNKKLFFFLILIALVIIYFSSLSFNFLHLDDYVQVVNNKAVSNFSIATIFNSTVVGMYQPLSSSFFAIIYLFFETKPVAYHLFSLLVHFLNCILVFTMFRKFSLNKKVAYLLSLCFAFHPMFVEAIVWVSALSTLTYSLFSLISFLLFISFLDSNKFKYYYWCLFCFLLACLAKSAAVALPVAFIFYSFLKEKKLKYFYYLPFFALSIAFGVITILSRENAGHLSDLSQQFNLIERFFLICYSAVFYPIKFLLPIQLSTFYAYPQISEGSLPFQYYLSPIAILLLGVLLFKLKEKLLSFSALFYLTGIALMLHFIPVGNQLTADRYVYLPSIGILLFLGLLIQKVKKEWFIKSLFLLPLIFIIMSFQRTKVWKNDKMIWEDVLLKNPHVAQAYNNLGSYEIEKGDKKIAFQHFTKAIELKPYYADAYSNRGNLFAEAKAYKKAMADFNEAIKLRPHADAYFNRGNLYSQQQQFKLAISDYQESLKLEKRADSYTNKAFAHLRLKEFKQAEKDLETALLVSPNFDRAIFLQAIIKQQSGDINTACSLFNKAMKLGNKSAKMAFQQNCK